jgi:hypothetical protein
MAGKLTPYDTGARLEPQPWTRHSNDLIVPFEDWGKVDFDTDEGATVATVWVEGTEEAEDVMHVVQLCGVAKIVIHVNGDLDIPEVVIDGA